MIKAEAFEDFVHSYWREARRVYALVESTEPSGYPTLEKLLKDCVGEVKKNLIAIQQPKQKDRKAPDFVIKDGALLLGYIEVKNPNEKLEAVLASEQIKGYLQLSSNLLVTNYESWALCVGREKETNKPKWERVNLGSLKNLDNFDANNCTRLCRILEVFLQKIPERIGDIKIMAESLAFRGKQLREVLHVEGKLQGLYTVLCQQLTSDLTVDAFKDAYAQTVIYGLFLARLNAPVKDKITLLNAKKYITSSFPVIKELADFLYELEGEKYDSSRLYVEEILSIIENLDLYSIQEQMTFKYWHQRQKDLMKKDEEVRLFSRDPFVYFYEDFLKSYDYEKRQVCGVYFTPPPIVNFIIKSIQEILLDKKLFNITKGLGNKNKVTLLDFATGTGTFLAEVVRMILDNEISENKGKGEIDTIIEEHILKNICGFEFLIAPYVAAHLKLSQVLKEYNYSLANKSIPVYLANTLEEGVPQGDMLLPALTEATKTAHAIKGKPILVITGNPPYHGESLNKGKWIKEQILEYHQSTTKNDDGIEKIEYLNEKNSKWLQDDYVKFIRFAQYKMESVDEGIVAIITNHTFLDNPTFRLMRLSLLKTFDQIYILDLHGNFRRKEKAPDGSKDENIFDIQIGVAISFFIKKQNIEKGIYYTEFWGMRRKKYLQAFESSWKKLLLGKFWKKINPEKPFYLFVPQNKERSEQYNQGWKLTDIFPVNSVGIATARDKLTIQFSRHEMHKTVKKFAELESEQARQYFSLPKDTRDWKVNWAQENIQKTKLVEKIEKSIVPIDYRIFDKRYIYYTPNSKEFLCRPRHNIMRHIKSKENFLLCVGRQGNAVPERDWELVMISKNIVDLNLFRRGGACVFPLYLYKPQENERSIHSKFFGEGDIFHGEERRENISLSFREYLTPRYPRNKITPEQILAYVYAILHDANYRQYYQEFLKYDFPRIPFPDKYQNFKKLSTLGQAIIDAHTLKNHNAELLYGSSDSNRRVEEIRYSEKDKRLYINKTSYFKNISNDVYNFHIGGYHVLEKYLKERKKRPEIILDPQDGTLPASTLAGGELYHFSYIVDALSQTHELMKKIAETTSHFELYRS